MIDAVWKLESARIIAGLTRLTHDVGLAEEAAQDALMAALEQWPVSGIPDNPGAWLTTTAKRRAVDHIRRTQRLERSYGQLANDLDSPQDDETRDEDEPQDDVLRLILVCCHPVLPPPERAALTLRLLGGLTPGEIARAFLVGESVIARRIANAKRTLAGQPVTFELPDGDRLAERLNAALEVIYLIFNEGYAATSGDDLMRPALCHEALRLGRLLAVLAPGESEVHGLVALMEVQASRLAARVGPCGELLRLHEQNRGRWDQLLIRRGFAALLRAREVGGAPGPYMLQAAIAVCHAQAPSAEDTNWAHIVALYDALVALLPTPVVRLNRAVALGMAQGPQAGLDAVDLLSADPALRDYHLLPGVRADLLVRLGRREEARVEFGRAADLARNAGEREFLHRRAEEFADAATPGRTLAEAAELFLAREDLGAATIRSYGQTLTRLCLTLGGQVPVASLTPADIERAFALSWGGVAARTWNRHRSAVRSFCLWASMDDLTRDLPRRDETPAPARMLTAAELTVLWESDRPPRERTLWRLLHESAASVTAVLALNVEDLDLDDRRATTRYGPVSWRSGTAELLPLVIAGRGRGPVFLSERRPGPSRVPAAADVCPETGRRRLSYERAEYLFKIATKELDPTGDGYTLSRLKAPAWLPHG